MSLPALSGADVVRELRSSGKSKLPIVVVSGSDRKQSSLTAAELWPGMWLVKPIKPRELVSVVRDPAAFRRRPGARSRLTAHAFAQRAYGVNSCCANASSSGASIGMAAVQATARGPSQSTSATKSAVPRRPATNSTEPAMASLAGAPKNRA